MKSKLLTVLASRVLNGEHTLVRSSGEHTNATQIARLLQRVYAHWMPLSRAEALTISKTWWNSGMVSKPEWQPSRVLRAPHHTVGLQGMFGLLPCNKCNRRNNYGEVDLAEGGVLFLDDVDEFRRSILKSLTPYYNKPGDQPRHGLLIASTHAAPSDYARRVGADLLGLLKQLDWTPLEINRAITEMDDIAPINTRGS